MKREMNQLIGAAMFTTGAAIFIVAAFMQHQNGSVPAAAFFIILMGIGCYFPDLFQDGSNAPSTMRICVLMIVAVFTVMVVKTGWTATNFLQIEVNQSWIYLLGLAFGAKVTQSFTEYLTGRLGKKGSLDQPNLSPSIHEEHTHTPVISSVPTNGVKVHYQRNVLAGDPDDYDI